MPAGQLLILVAFFAIFWFLLIRPQRNRQKQLQQLQSQLSAGDSVMLTSGIFGTVTGTTDQHVVVEVAEGVELRVLRAAVGQVVPEETDAEESHDELEEADASADSSETRELAEGGIAADDSTTDSASVSDDQASGGTTSRPEEK
ncbi:preprotein translocase subunit YajC [Nocardioides insulae]|uniref:preprotein translocase subunit YajC n=1 Tax=Nocardioides insulae TaxID=394734 RepID=UPI000417EFC4|nr:preprotein translocase subunit YajC [Nocardioides insulae]